MRCLVTGCRASGNPSHRELMAPTPKPAPCVDPVRLAKRLATATSMVGGHRDALAIQMTAVATGALFFGAGPQMARPVMQALAKKPDTVALSEIWSMAAFSAPFLREHLPALTGWAGRPDAQAAAVARACFAELAPIDLIGSASMVGGELLGPVYSTLRSPGSRSSDGAFYTPMPVARLIAEMNPLSEGDSFADPACGSGVLAVGAAVTMRRRGLNPATVTWVLNDIDPVAVALAGINAVIHDFGPNVVLRCGDGLALGVPESEAS